MSIEFSIEKSHGKFTLKFECSWDLFDEIYKNIDCYRNEIIKSISDYGRFELEESKNLPEGFWECIDNMGEFMLLSLFIFDIRKGKCYYIK